MRKTNVLLIGMPSAGKSTVGALLAKRLGVPFTDMDLVIQEKTGKLLKELIAGLGEQGFLELEERINREHEADRTVIATGGSVIYGKRAMEHYRETAVIVYLKLSFEELTERIGDPRERGVVLKDGMTLRDLYEERVPYYEAYADVTVEENGKSPEQIVQELGAYLEERGF